MIGVDTNILLRYLLDDDPIWSPAAERFIEQRLSAEEPGFVNSITLAELVWTLRRHSRYARAALVEVIESLLTSEKFVLGDEQAVIRALASFKAGGAGFADYLIAELNAIAGASTTMTIDRTAGDREPFTPLA